MLLGAVSLVGLALFTWPLLVRVPAGVDVSHTSSPFLVVVVLPVLIALVLAGIADGGIDATSLALLGVLGAVNAALRPLGAGAAGIELVFFLLVLAGRVFGPTFGFLLGCLSLFASALLTAGIGPWLPYQMLAAGWVGLGAGLLPRRFGSRELRGIPEIVLLCGYGVLAAYGFGLLMNLSYWPFAVSAGFDGQTGVAYLAGAPAAENLRRFVVFSLLSSGIWDTGRAITTTVLLVVLGPAVLAVLRRAARRARFVR